MEHEGVTGKVRKRKAENQDNERLSKRLSLLNIEQNGQKLYVPVEQPSIVASTTHKPKNATRPQNEDIMQLDDSAHKVYIYDLDAELSDSESSDDGKLVFLPDIEKHLRQSRIPPSILANKDGELAGNNQLVLYNIPSSISVPREQDSVRKAIIESRARAREKQLKKDDIIAEVPIMTAEVDKGVKSRVWYYGDEQSSLAADRHIYAASNMVNGFSNIDDPDAMDLG